MKPLLTLPNCPQRSTLRTKFSAVTLATFALLSGAAHAQTAYPATLAGHAVLPPVIC